MKSSGEKSWERVVRRFRWQMNLGYFLDQTLPLLFVFSLIAVPCVLWLRGTEAGGSISAAFLLSGLAVVLLAGVFRARKSFLNASEARVDLEYRLKLDNALTAASEGWVAWPVVPSHLPALNRWRWKSLLPLPLGAIFVLLIAAWVPLPESNDDLVSSTQKPPDLQQVEEWVKQLEEQPLFEEEAVEEFREQAEELAGKDEDEWYQHSSLEAVATLEKSMMSAISEIQQNMFQMNQSLQDLEKSIANQQGGMEQAVLSRNLQEALSAASQAELKIDPAMLEKISQLDLSQLESIDPGQLKEMQEALQEGMKTCSQCLGEGEAFQVAGTGAGTEARNGKVSRGPGTAPLTLDSQARPLGSAKIENVSNPDLDRAIPGKMLGVSQGEHEVDKDHAGLLGGGSTQASGEGGGVIWTEYLEPDEQKIIEQYFQ